MSFKKTIIYPGSLASLTLFKDLLRSLKERGLLIKVGSSFLFNSLWSALLLWPFWVVLFWPVLLFKRWIRGVRTIVCGGLVDKLIITLPARLSGCRVIWLVAPKTEETSKRRSLGFLLKPLSRLALVLSWGKAVDEGLYLGKKIVLPLAHRPAEVYQEGLYRQLAKPQRRRFVVGSVLKQAKAEEYERLISAIGVAVSICPIVELVIIGEGEAHKQVQWLVRKLGLEGHVWLTGEDRRTQTWFESLDLYLVPQRELNLDELSDVLSAMSYSLPVIATKNLGLDEIIGREAGLLIDSFDNETVANAIVKLQQNEELLKDLAKQASLRVASLTEENLAQRFYEIITND
ncbi:MAG: glycosyltransferase [Patescibacteria group bacterium]|nr:MAG: glycosyltransferase [Patescibacteria group bacterium]